MQRAITVNFLYEEVQCSTVNIPTNKLPQPGLEEMYLENVLMNMRLGPVNEVAVRWGSTMILVDLHEYSEKGHLDSSLHGGI